MDHDREKGARLDDRPTLEAEAEIDALVKKDQELREGAIQSLAKRLDVSREEALRLLQEAEPGF